MSRTPYEARLSYIGSFLGADGKLAECGRRATDVLLLICQDGAGWEDIYYLTGFTGSSGVLAITKEGATLFVDPRYEETAIEACCCKVVVCGEAVFCGETRRSSPLQAAINYLSAVKPGKVAYGGRRVRHSAVRSMEALLASAECPAEFIDLSGLLSNMRRHKCSQEADAISDAVRIASDALMSALSEARAGMSEREFAALLEYRIKTGGGDFTDCLPVMVSSGERTSRPHALPTERKFARGDLVMVDFCARSAGYVCDITRMLSVGTPSAEVKSFYSILRWAQTEAASLLRPGIRASDVDGAADAVLRSVGFGDCRAHASGHGIGLCVHEPPSIASSSRDTLAEGDAVTLEPGFYKRGWGGMRIEDNYLITKEGSRKFTDVLSDELFVVS